jgi:hypothetical protein
MKIVPHDLEIVDSFTKHLSSIFSESGVHNEMKTIHYRLKFVRYEAQNAILL